MKKTGSKSPSKPSDPRTMNLNDSFEKVRQFHIAFNHECPSNPEKLPEERVNKRYNWMLEELEELRKASSIHDQADAIIDLIYFALGTMVEMGVEPEPLFNIVHDANMNKLWPDGKVHYAPDGKVIKHPSWRPPEPQLLQEIERQLEKRRRRESNGHHIQGVSVQSRAS